MPSFRVVGPGRAGMSLVAALAAAGWESIELLGRNDDPTAAAHGVDLLVLATPDAAIREVAASVRPVPTTVVVHLSGATGLDALDSHVLSASLHPLDAYLDLATGSLDNVRGVGPSAALTGPAARGDVKTVEAHLAALPADERDTYRALAAEARRLAGRREPGAGT